VEKGPQGPFFIGESASAVEIQFCPLSFDLRQLGGFMDPVSSRRVFAIGQRIFTEGDVPDVAYLIESGRIEVWATQGHRRLTLSFLGPGEILGEMAVIDRAPRSASADALTEVCVTEIRADQLRGRLDEADPILRGLLIGLLSRYRRGLRAARVGLLEEPAGDDSAAVDQKRRVAD
jgi:diguanylate cyclase